jgi:hypothetical protein
MESGRSLCAGALTLGTLGAWAVSSGATPYSFSTGVEVTGALYDHRSSFGAPAQFSSHGFAPVLQYRAETPTLRLRAFARRGFTYYRGTAVESLVRGGVQTLDNAALSLARLGPSPNEASLDGSYTRSHDVLDLNQRILLNDSDVIGWTGGGALVLPFVEGRAAGRGWYYDRPDLTSAISWKGQAKVIPLRGSITSLFGAWDQRVLLLGRHIALQSFLAGGGVRRQVNPWCWAEAEAGISHAAWSDGTSASGPAGRLAIQTTRDVPEIADVQVELRRDLPGAVSGEVGYRFANGSLRLRGAYEPDVEGGSSHSVGLVRRMTLAGDDTLGRATVIGGEVSYGRITPLRAGGGPRAETIHATAWVLRRLRPWLSARAGGALLRQPVVMESQPIIRRMRLDVALIALLPGEGAHAGAW